MFHWSTIHCLEEYTPYRLEIDSQHVGNGPPHKLCCQLVMESQRNGGAVSARLSAHDQFGAVFVAYIKLTYSLVTILVNDVNPSVTSGVV